MKFCHPDALNQHDRTGLVRDHKQCSDIRCSDQILFPSLRSIYTCFFFFFLAQISALINAFVSTQAMRSQVGALICGRKSQTAGSRPIYI